MQTATMVATFRDEAIDELGGSSGEYSKNRCDGDELASCLTGTCPYEGVRCYLQGANTRTTLASQLVLHLAKNKTQLVLIRIT